MSRINEHSLHSLHSVYIFMCSIVCFLDEIVNCHGKHKFPMNVSLNLHAQCCNIALWRWHRTDADDNSTSASPFAYNFWWFFFSFRLSGTMQSHQCQSPAASSAVPFFSICIYIIQIRSIAIGGSHGRCRWCCRRLPVPADAQSECVQSNWIQFYLLWCRLALCTGECIRILSSCVPFQFA